MSFHPEPCYCEQAIAYQELLEQAYRALKEAGINNGLQIRIKETIDTYKEAQREYSSDDFPLEDLEGELLED